MLQAPILAALNHVLAQAAWARGRLSPFAGRRARIELPPLPTLAFTVDAEGYLRAPEKDGADDARGDADVAIALPAAAPLLALGDPEQVFKRAHISGNADFADSLGFVLRNLRWDFEEDLSRIVGDIAAHRIAGLLTGLFGWQREAAARLGQNLAEYLAEEQHTLLRPPELAAFSDEVGRLAADLARLEQRVGRLAR
ncbi:hypothetical protein B9N43_12395 [Denitratisoma sp. DHT3]|uniref:ubiquinone biosynthesis accessory factor UbiJ n=1 Tax=Denitratisoma sp. DHT3 TaxID=1981880 RepID=UPI001198C019|nr:hypothetical protein [Denitratisoma sp. DHT3]QDX81976.1 hypothetical protein B9N43_12395 [Denitratisoma sp. DHT3]